MPQNGANGLPLAVSPSGRARPLQMTAGGALKLKVGNSQGIVFISGGSIDAALAFLDIELPQSFYAFQLELRNLYCSDSNTGDNASYAVSADGGTTFINDTVNHDSYGQLTNAAVAEDGGYSSRTHYASNNDSLGYIVGWVRNSNTNAMGFVNSSMLIFPGGADLSRFFSIQETGGAQYAPDPTFSAMVGQFASGVNPTATLTPTPQRMNLMRILPYGNGDCNPPTSGETLVSGQWALYGIKF